MHLSFGRGIEVMLEMVYLPSMIRQPGFAFDLHDYQVIVGALEACVGGDG